MSRSLAAYAGFGGALFGVTMFAQPAPAQPAAQPSPVAIVDAMESLGGRHPGVRRSFAKGVCTTGEFVSSGAGARLSVAPTLAPGVRTPVQARFSTGGASPTASDTAVANRGLAIRMQIPGGGHTDFVLITSPVFGVREPVTIVENAQARARDPATGQPNAERVAAFVAAHPEAQASAAWLRDNPPSASWATAPYFGVNSFVFVNAAGERQHARWTFEPVAGRVGLTPEQRASFAADFLAGEFRERVARAPAEWRVLLQLPQPGDPLLDATAAWPAERETVEVGVLRITEVQPAGERGVCEPVMYNPLVLPRGIEPSADPVLLARPAPYGVSLLRRSQP